MQNPHPLVVHFPLALLLVSAVAALYAAGRGHASADAFARALLYLGTAACAVAVVTGFLAGQSVTRVARAAGTLGEHQNLAYVLLGLASVLSGWAFVARQRRRAAPAPRSLWVVAQLALAALVVLTGKDGGALVHQYGVGTALTARGGPLYERPSPAAPTNAGTGAGVTPGATGSSTDSSGRSPTAPPRPSGRDFR